MAGTAIAVALVPPVCVMGLMLSGPDISSAQGPALLYAANCKEINHQVDPKGLRQSHLSEDAQRGHEQGNDDPKDVAAGHQRSTGVPLS